MFDTFDTFNTFNTLSTLDTSILMSSIDTAPESNRYLMVSPSPNGDGDTNLLALSHR